jgi:hypothetical protein
VFERLASYRNEGDSKVFEYETEKFGWRLGKNYGMSVVGYGKIKRNSVVGYGKIKRNY